MKKTLISLALLAAAAMATPAFAQQAGDDTARVSGFRVEAHGGWDRINVDQAGGKSGVTYGLGLGYDFAVTDAFFIGVEGNLDDSSTKACGTSVVVAGDQLCAKAGLDWSAGVRVGFASLGGKLYALGGYTRSKLKLAYTNGGATTTVGDWGDGWRVGTGYQYTFSNGVYLKAEYRYSDYQGGFKRHNIIGGVGYQF